MEEGFRISADALPPQRIPAGSDGPLFHDRLLAMQRKLASAPISWGVCEVPGWGHQLPPERVLGEMASLGLSATELGPLGYLSRDPRDVRELLDRFGLGLVAGFVPLVLHDATPQAARDSVEGPARLLAELGAEVLTVAPVLDAAWSAPARLDEGGWRRLTDNLDIVTQHVESLGLTLALHPHADTVVETDEQVERVLAQCDVPVCLDTGHLSIGGTNPAEFVRRYRERIVHVHLKDVNAHLAARVAAREVTLVEATRQGLFRPLGRGDGAIEEVVGLLDRSGYERWLVLEQDTTLTGEEPPVGSGPLLDVRASVDYLASLAPLDPEGISQP
jgi:inosose dehydratase